jgi:hypothetical protein
MSDVLKNLNEINYVGSENLKYEPAVERSKPSKFRINSKLLFLTYSRKNLSPEEVLTQLNSKFDYIKFYVISQEEHKEEPEKSKHIHAFIELFKKLI